MSAINYGQFVDKGEIPGHKVVGARKTLPSEGKSGSDTFTASKLPPISMSIIDGSGCFRCGSSKAVASAKDRSSVPQSWTCSAPIMSEIMFQESHLCFGSEE
jgi:hypothetical protein